MFDFKQVKFYNTTKPNYNNREETLHVRRDNGGHFIDRTTSK